MGNQSIASIFNQPTDRQQDVLGRSIMEHSYRKGRDTSIMDIVSGYSMQNSVQDLSNRSMVMDRPLRRSIEPNQMMRRSIISNEILHNSSFISTGHVIFDEASDSNDCDIVEKQTSFNESDPDDCVIEKEDIKVKSTEFYYKEKLKEITTKAPVAQCFLEGESDDYGSEGSELFEVPVVNFDILDVRKVENPLHTTVLNLLQK